MNKTDLIEQIAERTDLEKTKVSLVVNGMLDVISEALASHEPVTLIGFGTFKVRHRKARKGVNPQTHKEMTIPAADVPALSAGESLKLAVAKKKKPKSFLAKGAGKKKAPAKKAAASKAAKPAAKAPAKKAAASKAAKPATKKAKKK